MATLSTKFAYLPNGIIREIIEYTGVTFKKRNGTYMGQISKTDPRYVLLLKIPLKNIIYGPESFEYYKYFSSDVLLFQDDRNNNYTIRIQVSGLIYGRNKKTTFEHRFVVYDGNSRPRHYEYDEDIDNFKKEMECVKKQINESSQDHYDFRKEMECLKKEIKTLGRNIIVVNMIIIICSTNLLFVAGNYITNLCNIMI
jgi:hypothetical protein